MKLSKEEKDLIIVVLLEYGNHLEKIFSDNKERLYYDKELIKIINFHINNKIIRIYKLVDKIEGDKS